MNTITPARLVESLQWRYSTKVFDPARKIAPETWHALEQSLVLAPSSFGLQPYQFLILTSTALREKLVPHAWNQRQVADCSHFVVFTARKTTGTEHIDAFIQRIATVRGLAPDSLKPYRDMMIGSIVNGPIAPVAREWAGRQAYIALGELMTSAALLEVDACPIEGFDPAKFDEILELGDTGFASAVCCALGYRGVGDKYAALPKVRLPEADLLKHR